MLGLLFFVVAFRFEVGCDWRGYELSYIAYQLPLDEIGQRLFLEPFFIFIGKLFILLDLYSGWMNVTAALIFFYGAHKIASRSPDPLSFLILFFPILIVNMPMSAIKQGAAIGVMCLAFLAFIDKKLLRYIALVFIATGFHVSAIIFLVFIPFVTQQINNKRLFQGMLFIIPLLGFVMVSTSSEIALARYAGAGGSSIESSGAIFRVGFLALSSIVFLLFFKKRFKRAYPLYYKAVLLNALFTFVAATLLPFSSVIADRISYYLIPLHTLFFVSIPYLQHSSFRRFWIGWPYLSLILIFTSWTSFSTIFTQCYMPYQSWIFEMPDAEKEFGASLID